MIDADAVISDPVRLQACVDTAVATDLFWESRPEWRPDVARAEVGGELVVWSAAGVFSVGLVAAVVARFLDGQVSLAQLVDDVADAAEVPLEAARDLVGGMAVELANLAAIVGVAVPEPPSVSDTDGAATAPAAGSGGPEAGETTAVDPETGEEIRVVTAVDADGHLVTTEHLSDGRWRTTTTMTFSAGQVPQALAAAQALAGDRSLAELVPLDSCLGSKLRNHDDVPLVRRRGAAGRVRSVRSHPPAVVGRVRDLFGEAREEADRGPIEAFVVTPLEGSGPVRVFDGQGRRRGRPRSVDAVVAVVDHILGEREAEALFIADPGGAPVPLSLVLVVGAHGEGHLVPLDALQGVGLVHRLESAGFRPTWGRAVL